MMTNPTPSDWSCDDQDGRGNCRNPHGCHCAEITKLVAGRAKLEAEVERLAKARTSTPNSSDWSREAIARIIDPLAWERGARISGIEPGDAVATQPSLRKADTILTLAAAPTRTPSVDENGLLPCPFCGGMPTLKQATTQESKSLWTKFACENIGCPALVSVDWAEDPQKAARDWNTRTPSRPDTAGEVEVPDFLKRMTGELPPLEFPQWRDDDDGREGRRLGAEEDDYAYLRDQIDLMDSAHELAMSATAEQIATLQARAEATESQLAALTALVSEKDAALDRIADEYEELARDERVGSALARHLDTVLHARAARQKTVKP